jgi:hypothetical protein
MWIAVMGLMMLAGGLVRERGGGFDDFGWRGGEQTASNGTDSGTAVTVIAGPPVGTVGRVGERGLCLRESIAGGSEPCQGSEVAMSGGGEADASMSTQSPVDGAWDVACESKRGHRMVFDRDSIREIGSTTLFRWAAAARAPESEDAVYTAVADCRAKSIEAHWPGKRTATRAGTCGRHLVEAVCAAREH